MANGSTVVRSRWKSSGVAVQQMSIALMGAESNERKIYELKIYFRTEPCIKKYIVAVWRGTKNTVMQRKQENRLHNLK